MSGGVRVAYVHEESVTHSFHDSLTSLFLYDLANEKFLYQAAGPIKMRCGTDGLPGARNKVAQRVLDDGDEWLLFIDSDMGFEQDSLDRLLAVADPKERPIVGALCFAQREVALDGMGGFVTRAGPTILDWREGPNGWGFKARAWYPCNTLVKCDGTGAAFILIHRSVLENIREKYGPVWYDRARGDEGFVSEDLSFCMRAGTVDAPIFVHTGVRITHMKTQWLGEGDFWEQAVMPPATEEVGVIVPVLNRPERAEPFMISLRASTGLAHAYAVVSDGDEKTADAWKAAGAEVVRANGVSFPIKANRGFTATSEPYVFLTGDDVRFHAGWLDHAQYTAVLSGVGVIGTNDLGNPRVMRGEHAVHMMFRRDYVEDVGASWDGPGTIAHEGYRHWFCDDEIVTAANDRNEFTVALGSKVEHLHPYWKKGEVDDTYRLGTKFQKQDRKVWRQRRNKFSKKRFPQEVEDGDD